MFCIKGTRVINPGMHMCLLTVLGDRAKDILGVFQNTLYSFMSSDAGLHFSIWISNNSPQGPALLPPLLPWGDMGWRTNTQPCGLHTWLSWQSACLACTRSYIWPRDAETHACITNTQEEEAWGPEIQSHSWLFTKFEVSPRYMRCYLKYMYVYMCAGNASSIWSKLLRLSKT